MRGVYQLSERRLVSSRHSCNVIWQRKIGNRFCKQQGASAMYETGSYHNDSSILLEKYI
jgi:hypothetical protein